MLDDDPAVRAVVAEVLSGDGIRVTGFSSATEFIRSLLDGIPDCLVLDLFIPEISGFAVLSSIVKAGIDLPVIILTRHDLPVTQNHLIESGAVAFLQKPVDAEVLLGAVNLALERRK